MSETSANPGLPTSQPSARRFRIFISYASEDQQIAEAIRKCLTLALGDVFAEINIDKWFLQPGIDFKKQIRSKLEITDVLIIVYTGTEKPSHGYTGWEVGFFDHVMQTSPGRAKVAFFLEKPPAITTEDQGISMALDMGPDKLSASAPDFEKGISVLPEDPLCMLITDWQQRIDDITKALGFGVFPRRPEQDPVSCVKAMKIGIFQYLKTTVDIELKPQKQFTIRATGATLGRSNPDLPGEAEISIPKGSAGSMAVFGLPDANTTWEKFLQSTSGNLHHDSWREAIASVIMSSFPDHINVDNSQIIVSSDDSKTYRVILTTAKRFYNDDHEFNIYFVEALARPDYGDASTTLLLKGLELVCRFRSMFLEDESPFSAGTIEIRSAADIPSVAATLLKELTLLRKDSRDAGLDDPGKWRRFVSLDDLQRMATEYRPREEQIRVIIDRIAMAKGQVDLMVPLQRELSNTLSELEEKVRPLNTLLLKQMTRKLEELVPDSTQLSVAS
jgi:hypothetical protein